VHGEVPARVVRHDLDTGAETPWKELVPADGAGVTHVCPIVITPDGRHYAYSFVRHMSELFLVRGVRQGAIAGEGAEAARGRGRVEVAAARPEAAVGGDPGGVVVGGVGRLEGLVDPARPVVAELHAAVADDEDAARVAVDAVGAGGRMDVVEAAPVGAVPAVDALAADGVDLVGGAAVHGGERVAGELVPRPAGGGAAPDQPPSPTTQRSPASAPQTLKKAPPRAGGPSAVRLLPFQWSTTSLFGPAPLLGRPPTSQTVVGRGAPDAIERGPGHARQLLEGSAVPAQREAVLADHPDVGAARPRHPPQGLGTARLEVDPVAAVPAKGGRPEARGAEPATDGEQLVGVAPEREDGTIELAGRDLAPGAGDARILVVAGAGGGKEAGEESAHRQQA
jgi:hypothetical protein